MERKTFFKSLVVLVASPSILASVRTVEMIKRDNLINKTPPEGLFIELRELQPQYLKKMVEKYGNVDFLATRNELFNPHKTISNEMDTP